MCWSPMIAFDFANSTVDSQLENFNKAVANVANDLDMLKNLSNNVNSNFKRNKPWFDSEWVNLKKKSKFYLTTAEIIILMKNIKMHI